MYSIFNFVKNCANQVFYKDMCAEAESYNNKPANLRIFADLQVNGVKKNNRIILN